MKAYLGLIAFFCLVYLVQDADVLTYCGSNPANKEECWSKVDEANHCCFVEVEDNQKNNVRSCAKVNQNEYENLKDYIEGMDMFFRMEGSKIKRFDCNASYIKLGLGLLLLLLF